MKKILCLLLALILVFSLLACGGNDTPDNEGEGSGENSGEQGDNGNGGGTTPGFTDEPLETPIIPAT